jgi:prefoldin subunit 5
LEIILSPEELEAVRRNKREIEKRFNDLEGLERTLKSLKLEYLQEHRDRLKKKLEEMRKLYEEMTEFEKKARRDKELLMAFRRELSEENRKLRSELEGKR